VQITVLHLEDSPIDMDLALSFLASGGIEAKTHRVETEEAFTQALQQCSFDLILADYSLPSFDGTSALRLAHKYCPETPFVFVSGAIGEEIAIDSLQHGATDYVLKHRMKRLVPAVKRALAEAAEKRARQVAERERGLLLEREQAARAEAEAHARRLESVNAELERFAFAASHDLKEPLRVVKTFAQLIARRYKPVLDEQGREFIGRIEWGVDRMETLIRDLLSYSRVVHEGRDEFEPVELESLFQQTLDYFHQQIEERSAVVSADPLPTVLGDRERIGHVFQNLIANSLKYTKKHPPEIRVSAHRVNDEWVVSIKDNGIGFDPRYSEQIFGLFKRLHRDEFAGTGVGLALSKQIIEQHGGRIWAESEPGEGSTFHFTFPATKNGLGS
jgi:light-regulated signal transduction histidine kinase (bacteriophytochrome)